MVLDHSCSTTTTTPPNLVEGLRGKERDKRISPIAHWNNTPMKHPYIRIYHHPYDEKSVLSGPKRTNFPSGLQGFWVARNDAPASTYIESDCDCSWSNAQLTTIFQGFSARHGTGDWSRVASVLIDRRQSAAWKYVLMCMRMCLCNQHRRMEPLVVLSGRLIDAGHSALLLSSRRW